MISKDKIESIIADAKQIANNYDNIIQQSLKMHNKGADVASAAMLMGMIQVIYLKSTPGEAVEDFDTMKSIIEEILNIGREKVISWDAERVKRSAPRAEETAKKLMQAIFNTETKSDDGKFIQRKAGDSLN